MATDFSNKQAFLKLMADLIPDGDAHYFQFELKFSSTKRPQLMVGLQDTSGAEITFANFERISEGFDTELCRFHIKGKL